MEVLQVWLNSSSSARRLSAQRLDVALAQKFFYHKLALISDSAISVRWRTLWKKMNRFTQCR